MEFFLDNLEAFVSAIALFVSITGAGISRLLSKKDMEKERSQNLIKEKFFLFSNLIFDFLELSSPEFIDDIFDDVFDVNLQEVEFNYNLMFVVDKAYANIGKRKTQISISMAKMRIFMPDNVAKTPELLDEIEDLKNELLSVFSVFEEELRKTYDNNSNTFADQNKLVDLSNSYQMMYESKMLTIENLLSTYQKELLR